MAIWTLLRTPTAHIGRPGQGQLSTGQLPGLLISAYTCTMVALLISVNTYNGRIADNGLSSCVFASHSKALG